MNKTTSKKDSVVEEASKFLVGILRHNNESMVSVDSRGWANIKDIRLVLREEFPNKNPAHLLEDILNNDVKNRFQIEDGDAVSFIRATRKHTQDCVDLIDPSPDTHKLNWYKFDPDNASKSAWVEATSAETAKELLKKRTLPISLGITNRDINESDFSETKRESVSESDLKSALNGSGFSTIKIHQSADKYLSVDVRSNMGGYKGSYVKPHPKRTQERLP